MQNHLIEEILYSLAMAQSLSEENRRTLVEQVMQEAESEEGLTPELRQKITITLEDEQTYLKNSLPTLDEEIALETQTYNDEFAQAKPHLVELVKDYEKETRALMKEYDTGYRELDKQLDHVAQTAKRSQESAEIESIKAKLSQKFA